MVEILLTCLAIAIALAWLAAALDTPWRRWQRGISKRRRWRGK
jgi:hypothetical protein